jgi:hypothetical protein
MAAFVRFYAPRGEHLERDAVLRIAEHVEESLKEMSRFFRILFLTYVYLIKTVAWGRYLKSFSALTPAKRAALLTRVVPRIPFSAHGSKLLRSLTMMGYFDNFNVDGTPRDDGAKSH